MARLLALGADGPLIPHVAAMSSRDAALWDDPVPADGHTVQARAARDAALSADPAWTCEDHLRAAQQERAAVLEVMQGLAVSTKSVLARMLERQHDDEAALLLRTADALYRQAHRDHGASRTTKLLQMQERQIASLTRACTGGPAPHRAANML